MSSWINFKELRQKLKLEAVLKFYGVTLNRKGTSDQYVGECPLPQHTGKRGNTFSANYTRHMWQCFGCRESGGAIDFAVLVVVQHPHSLWYLWQGGFENVVALMGESCGADQAEMVNLITLSTARIWLITETSDSARLCAETFLPKVAASRLCRWIQVKIEEEIAPDHPLLAALPRR